MKLVVGLGNPGNKYKNTRHNAGFMVLDHFTQKHSLTWKKEGSSEITHTNIGGEKIVLLKPQTFMNLSGNAVNKLMNKFDLNIKDIIVIYDDIDLPFSEIRVRLGGGTGGHNGITSIVEKLGSDDFIRIRVGIGRPLSSTKDVADYVLEEFTSAEKEKLEEIIKNTSTKLHQLLKFGYEEYVSKYNN